MKAVNDYIVVNKEKVGPKKIGGLILTEDLDEENRYIKATIVSTGNLVQGLKDGDIVYYDKHAGHGITWKDTMYQVIRGRDVVLVE
jgi:co-chaperonin GroES (HSP10)|tara:strand:- start:1932 stop:2189 length:258 start_codon:yes stop_codon:yes gene_type:complete